MFIRIAKIGNSSPINMAANELKKYLSIMDKSAEYAVLSFDKYNAEITNALWVGINESFDVPDVDNCDLDDAISIKVKGGCGYITGSNDRSVLIGAYRYLRELGCSFLRPGEDGEIVPEISLSDTDISVFEAASYRHRAVCIEGANSYNDVCDFIEWLPKVAMNGFYNQFKIPFTFYQRWYNHKHNEKNYEPIDISVVDVEGIMNETINEVKKRGLLYHAIGHGWTCEPFGIEGLGWYNCDQQVDDDIKKHFALLNGKRDFFKGVPLNTNLCYSSDVVKEKMADAVVKYALDNTDTDYIHVWLADGANNQCECDECRKLRPSDYYVQLLNKIDEKLTQAGSSAKIVFLIYVDLLWAPLKSKFNNPDRFVLMFAPISRTYSASMAESTDFSGYLVDYNRNKNKIPSSVAENIAHLNNWQKSFDGDSFDFDYHYMWDHFKDVGNFGIAKVLFDDMQNLDKIGLNGMVSCQCIRSFFPHGLGMNSMATALWDKTADFDSVADDYFTSAFGEDGMLVKNYMKELTRLSDPVYVRAEYNDLTGKRFAEQFNDALALVDEFKPVIERNINSSNSVVALSFKYLLCHLELVKSFVNWELRLASGDVEGANFAVEQLKQCAFDIEKDTHRVFDPYVFSKTIDKSQKKLLEKLDK